MKCNNNNKFKRNWDLIFISELVTNNRVASCFHLLQAFLFPYLPTRRSTWMGECRWWWWWMDADDDDDDEWAPVSKGITNWIMTFFCFSITKIDITWLFLAHQNRQRRGGGGLLNFVNSPDLPPPLSFWCPADAVIFPNFIFISGLMSGIWWKLPTLSTWPPSGTKVSVVLRKGCTLCPSTLRTSWPSPSKS